MNMHYEISIIEADSHMLAAPLENETREEFESREASLRGKHHLHAIVSDKRSNKVMTILSPEYDQKNGPESAIAMLVPFMARALAVRECEIADVSLSAGLKETMELEKERARLFVDKFDLVETLEWVLENHHEGAGEFEDRIVSALNRAKESK